ELLLPRAVGREGIARDGLALGVQLQEAVGDLLDVLFDPLFDPRPLRAAQTVQARRRVLAADILLQQIDLVGGYVQLVVARVLHDEVVFVHPADVQSLDTFVKTDAVVDVDYVVAGLQVGEGIELRRAALIDTGPAGRAPAWAAAENLGVG